MPSASSKALNTVLKAPLPRTTSYCSHERHPQCSTRHTKVSEHAGMSPPEYTSQRTSDGEPCSRYGYNLHQKRYIPETYPCVSPGRVRFHCPWRILNITQLRFMNCVCVAACCSCDAGSISVCNCFSHAEDTNKVCTVGLIPTGPEGCCVKKHRATRGSEVRGSTAAPFRLSYCHHDDYATRSPRDHARRTASVQQPNPRAAQQHVARSRRLGRMSIQ